MVLLTENNVSQIANTNDSIEKPSLNAFNRSKGRCNDLIFINSEKRVVYFFKFHFLHAYCYAFQITFSVQTKIFEKVLVVKSRRLISISLRQQDYWKSYETSFLRSLLLLSFDALKRPLT